MNTRIEVDSMGELEVPQDALFGAQTQRAINNFPVSGIPMPARFISALGLIKKTAAIVNLELGELDISIAKAIIESADLVCENTYDDQFPIDIFQTGSGTSSNMNANEVIAGLASNFLGSAVSANDHVNMAQSSNDTIPTAIHLSSAIAIRDSLLPSLEHLRDTILTKAQSSEAYVKTGRTHLMDAMPVRLSQELGGWALQVSNAVNRIESVQPRLHRIAQGGTAVGTGINTHAEFAAQFASKLSESVGIKFQANQSFFESLSTMDTIVELSGQLRTIAVSLMKISNDLRWMNSGPLAGLGEIELQALQPGSSIMPGKVNPVIPESTCMVCAQVMGNDLTISIAGQSGNFQLNVMLPVIAYNILQSIDLLANISRLLADKAIASFTVNEENLVRSLSRNPILVTALNPIIGYLKSAEIAKQAYKQKRPVIDVAQELTNLSKQELEALLDPRKLTQSRQTD